MKKQTKKGIWYWMIAGVGVLLILTLAYSSKLNNKADTNGKGGSSDVVSQEEGSSSDKATDQADQSREEDSQPASENTSQDYQTEITGGVLGQSYLLTNLTTADSQSKSKATVSLDPSDYDKLPRYVAKLENSTINLTLSDMSNFDFTVGQETYDGPNPVEGKGLINEVQIDSSNADQMILNIKLTKKAPFEVKKLTNPLRLELNVIK